MNLLFVALTIVLTGFVPQQHAAVDTVSAVHYRVYKADGTPSSLSEIEAALADTDVLFVGESHNDPIVHYLERRLLESAYRLRGAESDGVALSMEMFTRDVQYIVDEYLADLVTESQFLASSQPWDNYPTDYRPLVEFAKQHGLDVVAANAPRRYANRVSRLGRESLNDLSSTALSYLAPLPYGEASEKYAAQFAQAMREAMEEMSAPREEEQGDAEEAEEMEHGKMMEGMMSGMHEKMMAMMHEKMMAMMSEMHEGDGDEGEEMEDADEDGAEEMEHGDMEGMKHGEMTPEMHEKMMEGMQEKMKAMKENGETEGGDEGEEMEDAEEMETEETEAAPAHGMAGGMPNLSQILDSQSLWDATMAHSIARYQESHPGVQVVHVVGDFHVQTGTGIPEHLARYAPGTRVLIVSVQPAADIMTFDQDEHANLGDFVILSDEALPRTFDSAQ